MCTTGSVFSARACTPAVVMPVQLAMLAPLITLGSCSAGAKDTEDWHVDAGSQNVANAELDGPHQLA